MAYLVSLHCFPSNIAKSKTNTRLPAVLKNTSKLHHRLVTFKVSLIGSITIHAHNYAYVNVYYNSNDYNKEVNKKKR